MLLCSVHGQSSNVCGKEKGPHGAGPFPESSCMAFRVESVVVKANAGTRCDHGLHAPGSGLAYPSSSRIRGPEAPDESPNCTNSALQF